jgi:hypothetical protein
MTNVGRRKSVRKIVFFLLALAMLAGDAALVRGQSALDAAPSSKLPPRASETQNVPTFAPGPDVIMGELPTLIQAGSSGTQVGLMMATDICNNGDVQVDWFRLPETDHPVIPQNLYRMSGGTNNDERFEQIGQSWVKHAFFPLQQNACGFGCTPSPDSAHLGVGCSNPDSAALNAGPSDLGSRAWVNPFTGIFPSTSNSHTGHTHNGTTHRILVEGNDLNTTMNPGATYYGEAQLVTPHEYAWCQSHLGECNMFNNVSYRQFAVAGTTSFNFVGVGATVRMTPAISAWPGATIQTIEPEPGVDGRAFIAYKVTGPVAGLYHYEYAIYNQNLDRGIQSFRVPMLLIPDAGETEIGPQNIEFHAPPQHPGFPEDGTQGNAGYSSAEWSPTISGIDLTWSSETFAQNPNANAIRWGTLYNFRFDSNAVPEAANATIGFFKTGAPIVVGIQGPGPTGGPSPPPTPTPTPTTTPSSPTPSPPPPTPTATPSSTPSPMPCGELLTENFDSVTAPALPPGWSSSFWVTSTTDPDTAPNDAFVNAPAFLSDRPLDSPFLVINSAAATVVFRNNYNLESGGGDFFDGGVLEVSSPTINAGAFTDITDPAAGGSFAAGGYNGIISSDFGNPLAGRQAWSGNSGGYIFSVVNLGPNVNGQTIMLRFRMASDIGGGANGGWRIDTMAFQGVCGIFPPTATPTPTPTATPTVAPTPSPKPSMQAINFSTRMRVQTGDSVGIGGFIITGTAPKHVLLRAMGPSLTQVGVPGALADPVLELHGPSPFVTITDDNWRDDPVQEAAIIASGIPPGNDLEAAIDATLNPGSYTAVVSGKNNTSGIALVEVYDLDQGVDSNLANISTRAFVGTSDNIVIAGFMLGGEGGDDGIVVRGIGPSLTSAGVPNALADPTLELRDGNGQLRAANNDWQDNPIQAAELMAAGLAPTSQLESGIALVLPPGVYTALLAGLNNGTGIGLVEVYDRGQLK